MAMNFDLSNYQGASSFVKAAELLEHITEEMFISTDLGLPTRTVNHWEHVGLIDNTRKEGQRWRRFSFTHFVWIKLIEQLRLVGLPIETIKEVKELLMGPMDMRELWRMLAEIPNIREKITAGVSEEEAREFDEFFDGEGWEEFEIEMYVNPLQLLICDAVVKRRPISIAVFLDGNAIPITAGDELPPEFAEALAFETHAVVSLTSILKEFLTGDLAEERIGQLQLLAPSEARLLEMIHSGKYQSVKINFKDKKMASLELVKSQDVTKQIVDVLAESNYQDISITTHKGMVTKIENTIKVQL